MKKRYLALMTLLGLTAVGSASATTNVYADEAGGEPIVSSSSESNSESSSESSSEGEEVVHNAFVTVNKNDYGDILVDITEGNAGDVVTISAKPYILCKVIKVVANGVELTANEDGNYTFALIEGENIISVEFELNNEQLAEIMKLIESTKGKNLEDIFTIENISTILTWLITMVFSSGFFVTLIKTKKIKADTIKQVEDVMNSELYKAVESYLKDTFGPSFDALSEKLKTTEDVCTTLARCFILSQENTPEARIAIINELTALKKTDEELSEQVRQIIDKEINKNKELAEQKKKAIEELEKQNEEITSIATEKNEDKSAEGRY